METTTKKCSRCNLTYPATSEYFYNKKGHVYGLDGICKTCQKAYAKEQHKKPKDPNRNMPKTTHICPNCKNEYPLSLEYFHSDTRTSTGFSYRCKQCRRDEYHKYASSPIVREKRRIKDKLNREKYKEKRRAQRKEYYRTHKKEHAIYVMEKYHSDPIFKQEKLDRSRNYYHKQKTNPEFILKKSEYAKKRSDNLTDGFIRNLLLRGEWRNLEVSKYLIELKRKQLKLKRDVAKKQHRQSQEKADGNRRESSNKI